MKNIKPLTIFNDDPQLHKAFIQSMIQSIEDQIRSMGMIKGLVFRNAYHALNSIRPGYIEHVLDIVSRDYIREFSDLHEQYRSSQNLPAETVVSLPVYMKSHARESEEKFWKVADGYAQSRSHTVIGKTYRTLRPTIAHHLPQALDTVFQIIEKYTLYED